MLLLDIPDDELEPTQLISAMLKAPADLLWFGGIGTFVKAAAENNADVGDPTNDRLRVDGEQLRAKVVGEGANMGVTQAGDRKSVVKGKRVSVRVALGGCRIIKKKIKTT